MNHLLTNKVEIITKQVENLEASNNEWKNVDKIYYPKRDRQRGKEKKSLSIECDLCDMEFGQHCELEWHIKKEHKDNCLEFQCHICMKRFVIKWRFMKHNKIHMDLTTKQCKYVKKL